MLASRLQMRAPAIAGDRPFHDLGRALIDGGDAHVAADLFDLIFFHISVTAEGLDGGVGCGQTRFGGDQLGDGALGVQPAFASVDAAGDLFDVSAGGLQAHDVGYEQLVGVGLFLDEG